MNRSRPHPARTSACVLPVTPPSPGARLHGQRGVRHELHLPRPDPDLRQAGDAGRHSTTHTRAAPTPACGVPTSASPPVCRRHDPRSITTSATTANSPVTGAGPRASTVTTIRARTTRTPHPPVADQTYNTEEVNAGVSWKWVSLKLSSTISDFFGANTKTGYTSGSSGSTYLDLTANVPLPNDFTLLLHAGRQDVKTKLATANSPAARPIPTTRITRSASARRSRTAGPWAWRTRKAEQHQLLRQDRLGHDRRSRRTTSAAA